MTQPKKINAQLTPAAKAFIRRMCRFSLGPEAGFQLKVSSGGCSGFATAFDLVSRPGTGDFIWECEGLRIFLSSESRRFLNGATVDFLETLLHTGFVITTNGSVPGACAPLSKLVPIESLLGTQPNRNGRAGHGTGR